MRGLVSGDAPTLFEDSAGPSGDELGAPLLLRIEEAAERLGIGRTLMYKLVLRGEVESVVVGRLRRIPAECLDEYVSRLRTSGGTPGRAGERRW